LAPTPELLIHDDADTAIVAAARDIAARVRDAVAARGIANVAFSGGSVAPPMFDALAREDVPWASVHVFQVDERVAPDGHEDRNATALLSALVERVALPAGNVHLMPVTAADLDDAAADYGRALPRLDVAHMGIGPDGHTASWPPGDPVISECDRPVTVVGPFNGRLRMTITPGVVEDTRAIVFLVVGESKREALARMLAGDPDVPASHVPFGRTVVHADRAAIATTPDH
jgi:6-phosphogluconolactonase